MKANKSLISALLGFALLAIPITAKAQTLRYNGNRFVTPAYDRMYRPAGQQAFLTPVHDRDDWRWGNGHGWRWHDRDDWRRRNRDDWRWRDRDDWRWRNGGTYPYHQGYRPNYYPNSYSYSTPYYGAPVGNGLNSLMFQKQGAVIQYDRAVQSGDRLAAKHLARDIHSLNGRIATAEGSGYGYPGYNAFNSPYSNPYGSGSGYGYNPGYGYGNPLGTLVGPLLGNFIH